MHMQQYKKAGFSLVELSIVLVILGLLAGGVLGGRSLMRAAQLRAVTVEFQQWQTAVNIFKMQYHALPGDMPYATRFWGMDGGCGAGGAGGNMAPGYLGGAAMDGTCNGDGDGAVVYDEQTDKNYEAFLFWQHLSLAGLVAGNYTGVSGTIGSGHHVAGENAPRSRFGNAGWEAVHKRSASSHVFMEMEYGNSLLIGASRPADGNFYHPVFLVEEAWSIDAKYDDAVAAQGGGVIAFPHNNACTTAVDAQDTQAQYQHGVNGVVCGLVFRQAF